MINFLIFISFILSATSENIDFQASSYPNTNSFTNLEIDEDKENKLPSRDYNTIPNESGADYPTLSGIPKTSFTCEGKVESGYYADIETNCQVFHICFAGGHKTSFLCPNGSIFNEKYSVCDWWYSFDCNQISNEIFVPIQRNEPVNEFYPTNFQYADLNVANSGGNEPYVDNKEKEKYNLKKMTGPKKNNK